MSASKTMMVAMVSVAAACGSSAKPAAAPPSSTGDGALAVATNDCDREGGYELSVHDAAPAAGAAEVTVVGIYQARDDHDFDHHPEGTATVTTRRSGTLVVTSYEPVHWIVRTEGGAKLDRVIVSGYSEESAPEVPTGVAVEGYVGDNAAGYIYEWPGTSADRSESEAKGDVDMLAWIEKTAGRPVTRFRGCYHMTSITVD